MKGLIRSSPGAFALANLYLLFLTGPLISPGHQLEFHLPGSAATLFAAATIDLLVLTVCLAVLLTWARRHPRAEPAVWAALLFPLPWVAVLTAAGFRGEPAKPWALWLTGLGAAVGWVALLLRGSAVLPGFRRLRGAVATVLSFLALSGLVILVHLLWLGWLARGLNPTFVPGVASTQVAEAGPGAATKPRVVWIILDELSYRQLYGHRYPGLRLPNFDRLAAEATVFPRATAAAQYTRIAVPSLLTGEPLSATAPTADGRHLLLRRRGARGWGRLQPRNTVFGDAAAMGLPTSVAGWYEPYCRVLQPVLERCFWTYSDNLPGGLSATASVASDLGRLPREAGVELLHAVGLGAGLPADGTLDVRRHAADFRALAAAGDAMLRGGTAGLTLLHMPIPHPWGFYDRRTQSFPDHRTSYLDNLALADVYLGHLRALLEARGQWDGTDVVIMGDHGWRADSVWRTSGFWTPEEQRASRGAQPVDPPAVIVKLHGQHTGTILAAPFDAVRTRSLIDALLRRQLETPADLQRWLTQAAAR